MDNKWNFSGVSAPEIKTQKIILNGENLDNRLSSLSNADYVIESYKNGSNWYRLYKSGWIEMGGIATFAASGSSVEFSREMLDTDYLVYFSIGTTTTYFKCLGVNLLSKSTTGFSGFGYNDSSTIEITANWEVKGYSKI